MKILRILAAFVASALMFTGCTSNEQKGAKPSDAKPNSGSAKKPDASPNAEFPSQGS